MDNRTKSNLKKGVIAICAFTTIGMCFNFVKERLEPKNKIYFGGFCAFVGVVGLAIIHKDEIIEALS